MSIIKYFLLLFSIALMSSCIKSKKDTTNTDNSTTNSDQPTNKPSETIVIELPQGELKQEELKKLSDELDRITSTSNGEK